MKIIGTSTDGFIVEVTENEMAQLLGESDYHFLDKKPIVGTDVELTKKFKDAKAALDSWNDLRDDMKRSIGALGKLVTLMKQAKGDEE